MVLKLRKANQPGLLDRGGEEVREMGSSAAVNVDIDLEKIQAELSTLSQEDLVKQLLEIKTRQKITQKKYYNPETAKRARIKRSAVIKAMEDKAKQLGLYDQILKQAGEAADVELGSAEAEAS